jgi:hypothetical protein
MTEAFCSVSLQVLHSTMQPSLSSPHTTMSHIKTLQHCSACHTQSAALLQASSEVWQTESAVRQSRLNSWLNRKLPSVGIRRRRFCNVFAKLKILMFTGRDIAVQTTHVF